MRENNKNEDHTKDEFYLSYVYIAKKMLNHSRYYGGFMPCRVLYVEYGDGRRYLISMNMTLALYGGTDKKPINAELMEDMKNVKKAMVFSNLGAQKIYRKVF